MHKEDQEIFVLIKPQFEAGKNQVPKSGVIKDKNIHIEVIKNVFSSAEKIGVVACNLSFSPIKGPAGNIEYIALLGNKPNCCKIISMADIEKMVDQAHENL
jgi:23S rRNA (cytidine1920-2'-O)/16S rRNA (cytidine1409-2'-O)-methyltransferase